MSVPTSTDAIVQPSIVFLLDVDNTLLDNDALKEEIAKRIEALVGNERAQVFWQLYEEVRAEKDYVDLPTTVRLWTERYRDPETGKTLMQLLDSLPFSRFVYPDVFETLEHLWTIGTVSILSDGDQTFQPLKIRRSGLEKAVRGDVLIFVHKEDHLPEVFQRFPADHYVVVDDKPRILSALERDCPTTFTTIFVLQGKYAVQGQFKPEPDLVVSHIAELGVLTRAQFLAGARS